MEHKKEGIKVAIRRKSKKQNCPLCPLWQKTEQHGVVLEQFGVVWAHFGVILDKLGVILDMFGSIKTPKSGIFSTKNPQFSLLLPESFCFGYSISHAERFDEKFVWG